MGLFGNSRKDQATKQLQESHLKLMMRAWHHLGAAARQEMSADMIRLLQVHPDASTDVFVAWATREALSADAQTRENLIIALAASGNAAGIPGLQTIAGLANIEPSSRQYADSGAMVLAGKQRFASSEAFGDWAL